jgi:acetyltransferase-like isoleucine patch superfamily enzyme
VKLRNVKIGDNVLIAPGVTLIGLDHISVRTDIPIMYQGEISKQIIIEDDVWIATNVIVLKGVHIKRGCIIGAGAIVTKDC